MLNRTSRDLRSEAGVMIVLFAVILPLTLFMGSIVVTIGSWYTHGKHLQTKVDASALAGGGSWAFPCAADIDLKIEDFARQYVGPHMKADGTPYAGATTFNPQVGDVQQDQIHAVLNGPDWYDADSNPFPSERTFPTAGPLCEAKTLDVKGTEQDSPLLWGWLPFFPDIKKKARVEIQEVEGLNGLLPIAVRAPEPVSAAAVYYDEGSPQKTILAVKYFVKAGSLFGIPPNLQGWSTYNSEDSGTWASFTPTSRTGVAIAISFRGACNSNLPSPNTKIKTSPAPCLEDSGFTTVDQLCNQAASAQIVNCYYATGSWPAEAVQTGLHFIRGYPTGSVVNGPPQLRSAWLTNVNCSSNGYFNAHPNSTCNARLHVKVDLGNVTENPPGPPPGNEQTRRAENVEVKFRLVRTGGSSQCDYGNSCELEISSGNGQQQGVVEYSTQGTGGSPHLQLTAKSLANAVAIQVRVKGSTVVPNPGNCGPGLNNFSDNCRWFHRGSGQFGTSVAPTDTLILAAPVQRAFRGDSVRSSSIQWLRLTTDQPCGGAPEFIGDEAASQPTGANSCFFMDMGLKGGVALDQDEPAVLFDDGTGTSQIGTVDCDPNIPQGQVLEDGIIQGCAPWYAPNGFDTVPLCPTQNNLFSGYPNGNPGPPWTDWPPIECIKTRPTGQGGQMEKGFNQRFFNDKNNPSCPADSATGFVKGRNYWHRDNNLWDGANYADNGPPQTGNNLLDADPRLVTIFLAPTEAFTGSGQNAYPITGFISVYVTGYGRVSGNGNLTIDDPCPGSTPPPDLDLSGGSNGGYVLWGHIIKHVVPGPNATPSGKICQPLVSLQPCVATLVE